ncbi:glycosyltransferase, partial [Rheinheimera aquimaris]|uniref:glycosyltransferase n=1 Tax=Rheinheimera aquimaris TaxID=412437 RepID=UPI0032B1BAA1
YGTSPNKFFDYIASGLPVLNNYPGWLADYIKQEQCGFAVKPDDPSAFADALEQAATNRQALQQMGERAKQLAKTQFNRDKLADQWVNWVTGVVS